MQSTEMLTCYDCVHLAPVDVFNGVCHISKKTVSADAVACPEFEHVPKCKFCAKYSPAKGEPFLGTCGSATPTYPDLVAKTCESFRWAEGVLKRPKTNSSGR